jgi:hypothetical protein
LLSGSLASVIADVNQHGFDLDTVILHYQAWKALPFIVVVSGWNESTSDYDYAWFRSPKRGDWRYARRVERRFDLFSESIPEVKFFPYGVHGHIETSCLLLTLTYDRSFGCENAWRSIGKDVNLLLSDLRRKYSSKESKCHIKTVHVWESHEDGFPHVHLVALFSNHVFGGFSHSVVKGSRKGKLDYLIDEVKVFEGYWKRGFVKVLAMSSVQSGFKYLKKYLTKSVLVSDLDSKTVKTSACCWLFRKRSYGISRSWGSTLNLIRPLYTNSNRKIPFWACLDGSRIHIGVQKWRLNGFYKGDHVLLKGESGLLTRRQVAELSESLCFRLAERRKIQMVG